MADRAAAMGCKAVGVCLGNGLQGRGKIRFRSPEANLLLLRICPWNAYKLLRGHHYRSGAWPVFLEPFDHFGDDRKFPTSIGDKGRQTWRSKLYRRNVLTRLCWNSTATTEDAGQPFVGINPRIALRKRLPLSFMAMCHEREVATSVRDDYGGCVGGNGWGVLEFSATTA